MVTGLPLLLIFLLAIALLLTLLIRFKANPFPALLAVSLLTALLARMPVKEIGAAITAGFGSTLGGVGIVIGLGIIMGAILAEAQATGQIAKSLLDRIGKRNAPLAMNLTGYFIGIPVFMDAGFVILMPLARQLSRSTRRPLIIFITALSFGLLATHSMVIPTPGPLAVAENMGVDIGIFLLYALLVSLPASLAGGWLYGLFLGKRVTYTEAAPEEDLQEKEFSAGDRPSGSLSLFVLLFPILLILLGSTLKVLLPAGSPVGQTFGLLGEKNIALLLGVLLAIVTMQKFIKKPVGEVIAGAAGSSGQILLITGAGGAFGSVINKTGIGNLLVELLTGFNISLIVLGFILSALLRGAQGSATVALVTASAIVGPMVARFGASPVLTAVGICAGGLCMSLPNDSGFWVVSRFAGMSVPETFKSWTAGGIIGGTLALLLTLLLDQLKGFLPGL
jgi:GntP family gluconate:H+ symporter